jgi:Bacterial regulatory protein, Fis family
MPSKPESPAIVRAKADLLKSALEVAGGNVSAAAVTLGLNYATVQRQINRYDLADWLRTCRPPGRLAGPPRTSARRRRRAAAKSAKSASKKNGSSPTRNP